MMLTNALKTLCDFLLFFAFAALIDAYNGTWLLIGAIMALAFLSSLILQKTGKILPIRIICGLLPVLGLGLAQNNTEILITAVILVFYALQTFAGINEVYYEEYKYWFGIPAIPVIFLFITCLGIWPKRQESVVCAGLYLFLGVLVLRRKRMGAGTGVKHGFLNFAELAAVTLFGPLAGAAILLLLVYSHKVLDVLLLPVGLIINLFAFLLSPLGYLKAPEPAKVEKAPDSAVEEASLVIEKAMGPPDPAMDTSPYELLEVIGRWLLLILIAAIVIYLFIWLVRAVKNYLAKDFTRADIEEGKEFVPGIRKRFRRKKKAAVLSNNEKIRQIYKDYLFYISVHGVDINQEMTSKEVVAASDGNASHEMEEKLRELYIRARYREREELSDQEVKQAKELFNIISETIESL